MHTDAWSARTKLETELSGAPAGGGDSTHLPQDHLSGLSVAYEQQQAADQQLLLEGETLSLRVAAMGGHAVTVNLREHAGHLRKADL